MEGKYRLDCQFRFPVYVDNFMKGSFYFDYDVDLGSFIDFCYLMLKDFKVLKLEEIKE